MKMENSECWIRTIDQCPMYSQLILAAFYIIEDGYRIVFCYLGHDGFFHVYGSDKKLVIRIGSSTYKAVPDWWSPLTTPMELANYEGSPSDMLMKRDLKDWSLLKSIEKEMNGIIGDN